MVSYVLNLNSTYTCVQVVENESATGAKLHEKVTAMVHLLKWKGVAANDRVLMTVKPSVEFYAIAIAVFAVGKIL